MIPKIIHFIWLGDPAGLQRFRPNLDSWRGHHPTWDFKVWDDAAVATLPLKRRDLYERAEIIVRKSDILRYELLCEFGGLYVDVDVYCCRPFDDLLEQFKPEFFCGFEDNQFLCTALMGSVPHHKLARKLLCNLPQTFLSQYHTSETGPIYLTEQLKTEPTATLFPPQYFYPYSWRELHRATENFPEAWAIHQWAHTWKIT